MTFMPSQKAYIALLKTQARRLHVPIVRSRTNHSSAAVMPTERTLNSLLATHRQQPHLRWVKTSVGLEMRWTASED